MILFFPAKNCASISPVPALPKKSRRPSSSCWMPGCASASTTKVGKTEYPTQPDRLPLARLFLCQPQEVSCISEDLPTRKKMWTAKARLMTSGWAIRRNHPTGSEYATPLMMLWHKSQRALKNCWSCCIAPAIRSRVVRFHPCWEEIRKDSSAWIRWDQDIPRRIFVRALPEPRSILRKRRSSQMPPSNPAAVCLSTFKPSCKKARVLVMHVGPKPSI